MECLKIRLRIKSGEVLPLMVEIVSHCNIQIRATPSNKLEIISVINVLKRGKATDLIHKSLESEILPSEWNKSMIVKISPPS